ncbi:ABC transporter permease subunit [Stackebrandtia nassauensis]|uniref:Uncharacterized protein n=1 Tax=Stackebrandtia nassauensis (strain DSM 44728 / CIP 108903 / NRRL B-16338 / NBRC 102104 / LLR-40K-21) TaxID=446470 RepID=D3Q9X6_STANL|nr:ABC transporter permease subunit [Stackebrandtia nassauensis]ADD44672.1 hypothetical protein Snas_5035 [Stackebrandtia nassauensis DSM 44728]
MRLLSVELRRFASRRANILFAVIGLLFLAGSLTVLGLSTHKPTEAEISRAESQAEEEREVTERELKECEDYWAENPDADPENPDPDDFESGKVEDYGYTPDCEYLQQPSDVQASDYLGQVISFADEAEGQIIFLGVVFVVCALLMSGSFVGAEWTSGGMTNLLLWRPRRTAVYASKLTAALLAVLTLTIVASVLHIGGLYLLAVTNGDVGTLTPSWWQDNGNLALRFLALVAMATVIGVSLSMIGRRTVVAIGSVVAYLVVVEYGIRGLLSTVNTHFVDYWMLSTYVGAWLVGKQQVYSSYLDGTAQVETIYMWHGGGVLAAVTAILLAGSAVLFARRDTA